MFFDTNIIILYLGDRLDDFNLKILLDEKAKKTAYISSIVMGELLAYSDYSDKTAEEVKEYLFRSYKIVRPSNNIILLASEIARYRKQKTGKKLKLTDAIISATAILHDKPLFTLDKDDFGGVEGLKLMDVLKVGA